jgi:hypothetical protein
MRRDQGLKPVLYLRHDAAFSTEPPPKREGMQSRSVVRLAARETWEEICALQLGQVTLDRQILMSGPWAPFVSFSFRQGLIM